MKNLPSSKAINFLLIGLLFLSGCFDEKKITEIASFPEWKEEKFVSPPPLQDVYIFMIGDITENLFPRVELKDGQSPKGAPGSFKIGGLAQIKGYLDVLKKRLPDNSLVLSSGNLNLQALDSSKVKTITEVAPLLPIDAILLSHQDLVPPTKVVHDDHPLAKLPWVNSNVLSIKTGEPLNLWNSSPYKVFEIQGLKLGLMGVSSYQLLSSKERNEISGFYFQDPVTAILRTKNQLKKAGVDFMMLFYDGITPCKDELLLAPRPLKALAEKELECEKDYEIKEIINKLPPGTIDLVLTTQKHLTGLQVKETPIISLYESSSYLTGLRLTIDKAKKTLHRGKSFLLPAVKFCHQVYAGTLDCQYSVDDGDVNDERNQLLEKSVYGVVPARFLGFEVLEDGTIRDILKENAQKN